MRVLHCISTVGGGGAERQLAYLAGELMRIGWEVHVALLSGGPNLERLQATGAVIHRLAARGNHDPRILVQLRRVMRAAKPDLVQAWIVQMEVLGGLAARLAGIPWILSERASLPAYPASLKHRLRVLVGSGASAVIANSSGGDRYWEARLGKRVLRYVIPNALPLEEIEAVPPRGPEETGLGPEQSVVLFVGRFSPQKNLETLVAALVRVLSRPRILAVLCGEGPLRPAVERWLVERGIADRVRLLGYVPDVWRWMKRASVFVSASLFEGHPNAVLEAMACGCPLVVSDIPAHREFLDEESALLVKPDLPGALAEALIDVLSAPDAAARRVAKARARAAQWSIPAIGRRYDQVYREILAGRGGATARPD